MVFLRLMENTHTHGYALAFRLHLSVLRSLGFQFVVESRESGAWGPLGTKNTEQIGGWGVIPSPTGKSFRFVRACEHAVRSPSGIASQKLRASLSLLGPGSFFLSLLGPGSFPFSLPPPKHLIQRY